MDKKTLNNEIILCRGAVRKARVAVIRKLIRKIKILKSCKKENVKEKKLKQSERLFKRVQIMKKAKDDEVTRFALRNANLDKYIKGSKIDIRQNALARLAKHEAVVKKISGIREKIPNWEIELPLLLNSLGKKKKKLKEFIKKGETLGSSKPEAKINGVSKQKKLERQKGETEKQVKVIQKESDVTQEPEIEKVDDPFFMGKKVTAPKRFDNAKELKHKKVEVERGKFNKDSSGSVFNTKPFKLKKDSVPNNIHQKHVFETEEKLHPSWAAKKVKLIKPFEGKKIKFSDE